MTDRAAVEAAMADNDLRARLIGFLAQGTPLELSLFAGAMYLDDGGIPRPSPQICDNPEALRAWLLRRMVNADAVELRAAAVAWRDDVVDRVHGRHGGRLH